MNAIPSKQLSPIGKLVFYALAAKSLGTNRTVWISDGAIALSCGVSRPAVMAGLRQLLDLGLVEKVGLPVNQVQAYRICHAMFGEAPAGAETPANRNEKPAEATPAMLSCAKCHRQFRRLTKAGYCRGCSADIELAREVREVRAEHPGIEAEELACKIKDRVKLRRLTARVRRVLREAAA